MPIRLIVGLGNPGPEYEQTRHNAGFWLVDNLANSLPGTRLQRDSRYNAMLAKTSIGGNEVWLLEPLTFMNRSGQSVGALGTQDYWRLRLGIGHPRTLSLQQQVADFVLHRPRREDQELIEQAIDKSLQVMPQIVEGKFEAATMMLHTA